MVLSQVNNNSRRQRIQSVPLRRRQHKLTIAVVPQSTISFPTIVRKLPAHNSYGISGKEMYLSKERGTSLCRQAKIERLSFDIRCLLHSIDEDAMQRTIESSRTKSVLSSQKAELQSDLKDFCDDYRDGTCNTYGGALPLCNKPLPGVDYLLVRSSHRWRQKSWVLRKELKCFNRFCTYLESISDDSQTDPSNFQNFCNLYQKYFKCFDSPNLAAAMYTVPNVGTQLFIRA